MPDPPMMGDPPGEATVETLPASALRDAAQAAGAAADGAGPPALPGRDVSASSIEDAYVRFIFYCNPALPPKADAESLREAFRSPPRSGGKVFHPFAIYDLVRKFYAKKIRTWTELTTLLGVDPPDLAKDESTQKVAQYGVRLKKWMNSMHVRAFFEYLMNIPNDYWTKIPLNASPTALAVRDGVAIEDDMALRALIPHIRPKRGRKRPDGDELAGSPAQRQRISPQFGPEEHRQTTQPGLAHGPANDSLTTDADALSHDTDWRRSDGPQMTLVRGPQSAATPMSRASFWNDAFEPRSAVTLSRMKPSTYRRGAKNVSSAWKPGGMDSVAKQRGRPPVSRTPVDTPSPATQSWTWPHDVDPRAAAFSPASTAVAHFYGGDYDQITGQARRSEHGVSVPSTGPRAQHGHHNSRDGSRPARPSISLQVPERQGGSIRLATPPPHGPEAARYWQGGKHNGDGPSIGHGVSAQEERRQDGGQANRPLTDDWQRVAEKATDAYEQASSGQGKDCEVGEKLPEYYFEKTEDRTNVDALVSYFVRSMADSEWLDVDGKPAQPASVEESTALVNAMLQNMYKTSMSPQTFLMKLAALAGSMMLMTNRPKCVRLGEDDESYIYKCDWEYRFGHVKGIFTMPQHVPRTMWRKPTQQEAEGAKLGLQQQTH